MKNRFDGGNAPKHGGFFADKSVRLDFDADILLFR
jgi:hypothetical protein